MSYISTLNLLGDDSPIPITEEALNEELALWANAQFTFDTEPGTALPDDSYKTVAEQQELLATLANLNDHSNTQLLYNNILSQPHHAKGTTGLLQTTLPKLAPAPTSIIVNKEHVSTAPPTRVKKRSKSITTTRDEEQDEDKRKRNTAASARFRMKKKLREQTLERTAKEMTLKAEALEKRVLDLEKEAKWLRALVVEKDPTLLK